MARHRAIFGPNFGQNLEPKNEPIFDPKMAKIPPYREFREFALFLAGPKMRANLDLGPGQETRTPNFGLQNEPSAQEPAKNDPPKMTKNDQKAKKLLVGLGSFLAQS